jgi:prephenate dehydrogenase
MIHFNPIGNKSGVYVIHSTLQQTNGLIIGAGLMGGSLALAVRRAGFSGRLTGIVRSRAEIVEGPVASAFDSCVSADEFCLHPQWDTCDWIVLATHLDSMGEWIHRIPVNFSGWITDLASAKQQVLGCALARFGAGGPFVSSHPMAGTENSGMQAAQPTLFDGKLCLVIDTDASPSTLASITAFWQFLGCTVMSIDAALHDRVLSYLSHAPHILSSLIARWAADAAEVRQTNDQAPMPLLGGGLRDMLRIAGSNPAMWEAIITDNHASIHTTLVDFRSQLDELIGLLEHPVAGEWASYFRSAGEAKSRLLTPPDTSSASRQTS